MSKFSNFVARIKDTNVARSSHFYIELTPPPFMSAAAYDVETVNLYCQQAQIPEMVLQTTTINDDGLDRQVVIGKQYGRAAMVFVCDQDMLVRKFFEDWIQRVVVSDGGVVAYPSEYTVDTITVNQLNKAMEVVYSAHLKSVYPVVLHDLPLSTESRGLHLVQVQFVYRKWESEAKNSNDLTEIPDDIRDFISSQRLNLNIPPAVPQLNKMNSVRNNPANLSDAGGSVDTGGASDQSATNVVTDPASVPVGQNTAVLNDQGNEYHYTN